MYKTIDVNLCDIIMGHRLSQLFHPAEGHANLWYGTASVLPSSVVRSSGVNFFL